MVQTTRRSYWAEGFIGKESEEIFVISKRINYVFVLKFWTRFFYLLYLKNILVSFPNK